VVAKLVAPTREQFDQRQIIALNDPLLRPLIDGPDERSRQREIERLVVSIARPIIDRVLVRHFARMIMISGEDADDVVATVMVRLMGKLRLVTGSIDAAIRNFDDYVSEVAHHAARDIVRTRFPARTRLENRLRYVLTRDSRLALWSVSGSSVAGLAAWTDQAFVMTADELDAVNFGGIVLDPSRPADALAALFKTIRRPVRFSNLVSRMASLWHIHDEPDLNTIESIIDERPSPLAALQSRQLMNILWDEIVQLPRNQCAALLLNLRDSESLDALALLPLSGVATTSQIADAIGIGVDQLMSLWKSLPLEDRAIGELLNVTRQQVINLRKSARERLRRRVAKRTRQP